MGRYNKIQVYPGDNVCNSLKRQGIWFIWQELKKYCNVYTALNHLHFLRAFQDKIQNWEWSSQEIQFMKGKQNISCFRCIYLLVVYLLGKGVSWIGVTSKHWQRYEGRRSLMLLNKNQADLRWTWNSTAKESNWAWKPCKEKQNYPWWDFWIHITEYFKNPKLKNQAMKGFWGKPLFLTYVVGGKGGERENHFRVAKIGFWDHFPH